ncbi:lipase family protein [Staphylococcus schweitzeri]|uniref:lipase family protein n=1 Tax=Staphylococcus schweitzeri TaxID=1654388 RepID=UPI00050791E4|nr:lipase family protein [Staphylococcus schweitzeri]CDR22243.1 lipase family protein [Staphylococcus schweitzeri]
MKDKYKIDPGTIKNNTEETTAISKISYEVENANLYGADSEDITRQIEYLKIKKKFPSNLEYVDSYTDSLTGVTTSAFLNKDTGKVTLGMTGTNFQGEAFKKLKEGEFSRQNFTNALETVKDGYADIRIFYSPASDQNSRYANTQEFIKKIKNKYDIDFITGHSLGGREAVILGMSNGIPNIVVYNPAPIAARYLDSNSRLFKLYKGYKGNITRVVSDKDWLTNLIKGNTKYTYFGNEIVVHNGKSHEMDGFLTEQEQKIIKKELKKLQGYAEENNKSFVKNSNNAMSKLASIELLRANMMTTNGGWLSSSQQKVLESLTALTIAQSFNQLIEDEINQIKKMYNEKKKKFEKNWEDAQKAGNAVGEDLSVNEVLNALDEGQVNESSMVGDPEQMISLNERQLSTIKSSISNYIMRVRLSINEIVDKDQVLASQIGGLL